MIIKIGSVINDNTSLLCILHGNLRVTKIDYTNNRIEFLNHDRAGIDMPIAHFHKLTYNQYTISDFNFMDTITGSKISALENRLLTVKLEDTSGDINIIFSDTGLKIKPTSKNADIVLSIAEALSKLAL